MTQEITIKISEKDIDALIHLDYFLNSDEVSSLYTTFYKHIELPLNEEHFLTLEQLIPALIEAYHHANKEIS